MGDRPPKAETERLKEYKDSLKNQQQPIPKGMNCRDLARKAKAEGLWIYDKSVKRWFTPEELVETYERMTAGQEQFLAKMQLRDPLQGIEAAHIQIKDITERLEIFTKKVIEYYKKV